MVATNEIQHDQQNQCFILAVDGKEARLDYRLSTSEQPSVINFTHTYVPAESRGKGCAEYLVRHGLQWAREQGYNIRASCWYVGKFLR